VQAGQLQPAGWRPEHAAQVQPLVCTAAALLRVKAKVLEAGAVKATYDNMEVGGQLNG